MSKLLEPRYPCRFRVTCSLPQILAICWVAHGSRSDWLPHPCINIQHTRTNYWAGLQQPEHLCRPSERAWHSPSALRHTRSHYNVALHLLLCSSQLISSQHRVAGGQRACEPPGCHQLDGKRRSCNCSCLSSAKPCLLLRHYQLVTLPVLIAAGGGEGDDLVPKWMHQHVDNCGWPAACWQWYT